MASTVTPRPEPGWPSIPCAPAPPFSHDQPDNARRCIELGVARAVRRNRVRADRLAREVRAVLDDPVMAEKARRIGDQIRAEPGVRAAADTIGALED